MISHYYPHHLICRPFLLESSLFGFHNTPSWPFPTSLAVASQTPLLAPPSSLTPKYIGVPRALISIHSHSFVRPPSPKAFNSIHVLTTPKCTCLVWWFQHHHPHTSVFSISFHGNSTWMPYRLLFSSRSCKRRFHAGIKLPSGGDEEFPLWLPNRKLPRDTANCSGGFSFALNKEVEEVQWTRNSAWLLPVER